MNMTPHFVRMRGVSLSDGLPKVCVSVMGRDALAMADAARRAVLAGAEILEIRIDSFRPLPCAQEAADLCRAVREAAGDLPVIFTQRTVRDGGAGSGDAQAYEALLCAVAKTGLCDAIDVELSVGEAAFARIADAVHAAGALVVGSSHEFGSIGDPAKVGQWLSRQAALGADVCKAAVMPQSRTQAFELAREMAAAKETLGRPYIAIIMGEAGVFSRVCAKALGSCLTFGAVGAASAPGQIEAGTLREMLRTLA